MAARPGEPGRSVRAAYRRNPCARRANREDPTQHRAECEALHQSRPRSGRIPERARVSLHGSSVPAQHQDRAGCAGCSTEEIVHERGLQGPGRPVQEVIETERLFLRRFTMNDLDELAAMTAKPEFFWFAMRRGLSREETETMLRERFIDRWEEQGFGHFAVIRR